MNKNISSKIQQDDCNIDVTLRSTLNYLLQIADVAPALSHECAQLNTINSKKSQ